MLTLAVSLVYVSVMIHLANVQQIRGGHRPLLTALNLGLAGIMALWTAEAVIIEETALAFVLAAGAATVPGLLNAGKAWGWIGWMISRLSLHEQPRFDRCHPVHRLAVMLMIFQAAAVMRTLVMGSRDFSYDNAAHALANLMLNAAVYATLALMGVGWLMRRDSAGVCRRLGLRLPQRQDWLAGMTVGTALYIAVWAASSAWASLVAPDTLQEQTAAARQLFDSFNSSLVLAALFALLTAASEEMLFRGALQPIFGLLISSLFFTWLHIQYALTPAALILFAVSLCFGLLRRHISATAAIIAHSAYNFIPLLMSTLLSS